MVCWIWPQFASNSSRLRIMSFLEEFLKFIIFKETIPYKNESYFRRILQFRATVMSGDRKVLWQFRSLYAILFWLMAHWFYLYSVHLDEIDSYVQIDYLQWFGLTKTLYFFLSLFGVMIMIYLNLYYRSPDADLMFRAVSKCFDGSRLCLEFWPFHYKHQNSCQVVKKLFYYLLNTFQALVVIMGKYRNFPLGSYPMLNLSYS